VCLCQSYGLHHKKQRHTELLTYVDYVELGGPAHLAGLRPGILLVLPTLYLYKYSILSISNPLPTCAQPTIRIGERHIHFPIWNGAEPRSVKSGFWCFLSLKEAIVWQQIAVIATFATHLKTSLSLTVLLTVARLICWFRSIAVAFVIRNGRLYRSSN